MKRYRIFWIDDEHERMSGFKANAAMEGIDLVSFKSLNKGMDELRRNYNDYDGVLLDAKIFEDELDESGTEDVAYVFQVKEQLSMLPKKFQIFVYTGQAEIFGNQMFHNVFNNVFKKADDQEEEKLFEELKKAADQQEDTQIRHDYYRVFELCSERYIGERAAGDLLYLLKIKDDAIDSEKYLNAVRQIIEDVFLAFYKHKLLPDVFVINQLALNETRKFLAGESVEKGFKHLPETHLHPQIAYFLKTCLHVTQTGSHRTKTIDYIKFIKTPYLFKSTLYQLLDILVWTKMHLDSNPKKENWEKETVPEASCIFEGELWKDEQGNYYCDKYILSYKYVENEIAKNTLAIGDRIRIMEEKENTNPNTKTLFPMFGSRFKKIEY